MNEQSKELACQNCNTFVTVDYSKGPHRLAQYTCQRCGLNIYPAWDYFDLDEVNALRASMALKPVTELPPQKFHT
jgi:hypothetical protein